MRRNLHEARVRIVEAIETHFRQTHSTAEAAKPFVRPAPESAGGMLDDGRVEVLTLGYAIGQAGGGGA
ncbi:MAG: hypothetical protein HY901_19655 [Deltaproteobacteria bacterium]|nr:hypothetical protein [Deltaproteobacteria bacterium]